MHWGGAVSMAPARGARAGGPVRGVGSACADESAASAEAAPARNPRALGAAFVADRPASIASLVRTAPRGGLQHPARPGARARRRLLHQRPRTAGRRSRAPARRLSIRWRPCSPTRARPGSACTPGSASISSRARSNCPRRTSTHLPASGLADGAEADRAGSRAARSGQSRLTSARLRAGRAASSTLSKDSTSRRCCPRPPPTPSASSLDLARRYELDGVHLDYARFPNEQFDYSRFAIAAVPRRHPAAAHRSRAP